MNRMKNITRFGGLFLMTVVCLFFSAAIAFAGDEPAGWRPIYDLVMRWVNFLILAFVIVKFGKAPLMNFLRGQQDEYEREIHRLEEEKENALVKVKKTQEMIADSTERFNVITERIVAQGIKKKQAIIHGAGEESRLMIESAKRKIDSELVVAREKLRMELVDMAVAVAIDRMADEFNAQDDEKSIERFVESIETV